METLSSNRVSLKQVQLQKMQEKYEGKTYPTKSYGVLKIIKYTNVATVEVEFVNSGGTRLARLSDIRRGEVRDTSVCVINKKGIMDLPNEVKRRGYDKAYRWWNGMLQRCYNENMRDRHPTYLDCTVSESFKYYSKFKAWCKQQKGYEQEGWHLDKDILVKGNKIYSEDTCCFVPAEINCLMTNKNSVRGEFPQGVIWNCTKTRYRARIQKTTGWVSLGTHDTTEKAFQAYKLAKEAYVKEVANKWKDQLDHKVYEALINWRIEIND